MSEDEELEAHAGETKICVICNTEFLWRQKWRHCWAEVTTCSDICKKKGKKNRQGSTFSENKRIKLCAICEGEVELAYRCKYKKDEQDWSFVCRECWPSASGTGYLEKNEREKSGDPACRSNPYYVYGGTWKATTGLSKDEIKKNASLSRVK